MNSPASPEVHASGPELAQVEEPRSWRPLVVPAIIVIIGLAIAWALFAHFGRSKPDASGAILKRMAFPVQIESSAPPSGSGMAGAVEIPQHEMIFLVDARITNVSKKPITIFDIAANIKLNGTNNRSSAALPEDIDRLFKRFPQALSMRTQPLARNQVIQPGKSAEGLMAFNFDWTQQQWSQRTDPRLDISFQNARTLIVPLR